MSISYKILISLTFFVFLVVGYQLPVLFAQTSPLQIIFTWQANNFYPSNYIGKAAATINTPITISITTTQDGKVIALSGATITWYVDGKFFKRGENLGEISFRITKLSGDEYFVRTVVDFGDKQVEGSVIVPTLSQRAVIAVLSPNNFVQRGEQVVLRLIPFFFNVFSFDDFLLSWDINNQNQPSQEREVLLIDIGSSLSLIGTEISVSATASNKRDFIETARSFIRLTVR